MPLSQSCLFLLVHPSVVVGLVLVHMVVIVVGVVGGVVCEGLGMSQHQLFPSHWLRCLLLQFPIFWHITGRGQFVKKLKTGKQEAHLIFAKFESDHRQLSFSIKSSRS